ncbi:ATP-binding protein [Streptomyces sp. NBC_00285]
MTGVSGRACGCRSCHTTRRWTTTTSSFQPEPDPRKVKDLATLSFVDAKVNAALLGPGVIAGFVADTARCDWP